MMIGKGVDTGIKMALTTQYIEFYSQNRNSTDTFMLRNLIYYYWIDCDNLNII